MTSLLPEQALNLFNQEEENRIKNIENNSENLDETTSSLTNSQQLRILQLCIELQHYSEAISVGVSMLNQDNTQYRVYYYLAWTGFYSYKQDKNDEHLEDTKEWLSQAKKYLLELKKTRDFSRDDAGLLQHTEQMIKELGGDLEEIDISKIDDAEMEKFLA